MTPRPYFSILIPTKNRSEIVGGAIDSALQQTFDDFELIISDNDDSPVATREAVLKYTDKRIRYFRTSGNLPMHENWENALNHANGRFILILEDKMRLTKNALSILTKLLKQYGDVVISYDIRFVREEIYQGPKSISKFDFIDSDHAVEMFRQLDVRFFKIHPKSLDSCAPLDLIQRAKQNSPTGMFFSHVTPDYSSGFLLLRTINKFLFLDDALVYIPNNWMAHGRYSVGQSSYNKTALTARWLNELPISIEEIQQFSPVKCQWLWINNVLYDYFTKYKKNQTTPQPDWICFHAFCLMLVINGWRLGANMSEDLSAINDSLRNKPALFRLRVYMGTFQRVVLLLTSFLDIRLKQR
jgi:glycosyltransferase involved in cell wall biosynthesis